MIHENIASSITAKCKTKDGVIELLKKLEELVAHDEEEQQLLWERRERLDRRRKSIAEICSMGIESYHDFTPKVATASPNCRHGSLAEQVTTMILF